MIIVPEGFKELFDLIKKRALHEGPSLCIYVSATVDSIAASRMLTALLKKEDIPYQLKPTRGYEDLVASICEAITNEQVNCFFLIGCGGVVDLEDLLDIHEQDVTLFVLDSHRPYHLTNIYSDKIVLMDDGTTEHIPTIEELQRGAENADYFEEDDDDDDDDDDDQADDENEEEETGVDAMDQVVEDEDETTTESENDNASNGNNSVFQTRNQKAAQRTLSQQKTVRRKERARRRQRRVQKVLQKGYITRAAAERRYYEQTRVLGTSVSGLVYELASQVSARVTNNEFLWPAIVGLSDQWIHGRIDRAKYEFEVDVYRQEVNRFNPIMDAAIKNEAGFNSASAAAFQRSSSRIIPSQEFMFTLHRHWSFYESMWHSRYLATRLGIWKDSGKKVLDVLLAKLGVTLRECKQLYSAMDVDMKRKVESGLAARCEDFGLHDISYPSFCYQQEFHRVLSAADKVHIVSALLERGMGGLGFESSSEETRPSSSSTSTKGGDESDDGELGITSSGCLGRRWQQNFWDAFDALAVQPNPSQAFELERLNLKGIETAIELEKAVIRQGAAIIEKKIIVQAGPLRYLLLKQTPDLHFFTHPLSLSKLALFLVEYMNERKHSPKPFLVCARNEAKRTYLAVGVSGIENFYSKKKYRNFGRSFRKAAQRTKARIRWHSFDSSVVEVAEDDITAFVEYLRTGLL
ncbi:DNA replication initiation factor cdc45 [Balamuthia mandrillaris]